MGNGHLQRRLMTIGLSALVMMACCGSVMAQTPVTFDTTDGVTVYAADYETGTPTRPVILMFHQAGSNDAEYATAAPRLVKDGFNCVAVDQRVGGNMFNATNRTVAGVTTQATGYLDVLKDMNAALAWVKQTHPRSKVIALGSSYSAALVFLFASQHPSDIAAVVAFSPGEYLTTPSMVADAAAKLTIPVYITTSMDKTEQHNAHHIFTAIAGTDKTLFVPKAGGVHGASTLRTDRNSTGAAENWAALEAFLAKVNHATAPPTKAPPHPAQQFPAAKLKPVTVKPSTTVKPSPTPKPVVKPIVKPVIKPKSPSKP